jgi:HNH endonuclease
METWRQIHDYPTYEVSDLGNIRNSLRVFGYKNKSNNNLKPQPFKTGYAGIDLCKGNTKKRFLIHRLVAQAFIPNPENKPCVNHKNGIRNDNRLINLEWVTKSENTQHAIKNNRLNPPVGERSGSTKLDNTSVLIIREAVKIFSLSKVANYFNMTPSAIHAIKNNRTWKASL